MKKIIIILISTLLIAGCVPEPPKEKNNVCAIFREYPKWYWAAQKSQKKWGVPISVQMAIIYQESRFQGRAKPPRTKLLWVIPWKRPTSAYGYSQALDSTFGSYKKETGNSASRKDFADAIDFIGWYCYKAHIRNGIPRTNAYALYLAYHEGMGGYTRGTFNQKPWLIGVAKKVQQQANNYHYQLVKCQDSLPKKPWWRVW